MTSYFTRCTYLLYQVYLLLLYQVYLLTLPGVLTLTLPGVLILTLPGVFTYFTRCTYLLYQVYLLNGTFLKYHNLLTTDIDIAYFDFNDFSILLT